MDPRRSDLGHARRVRIAVLSAVVFVPVSASAQELLVNAGFETPEAICGYPGTTGDWGVDGASIVTAEAGVAPTEGARMARLEYGFFNGSGPACTGVAGGASADVAQLANVTTCHPAGNSARLGFSASFARSATGGVDQFSCVLRAYAGAASSFSTATPLAASSSTVTPGAAGVWVTCATELDLPPSATYVAAYVTARVVAGSREVYADDASLVPVSGRCGYDCTAPGASCPDPSGSPNATICDFATGLCVEPLADAGVLDAGPLRDASSPYDGGPPRDAGPDDDAGSVRDAGPDVDAGPDPRDGGTERDGSTARDGGADLDGGARDGGDRDAGTSRDGGARDAGARDGGSILEVADEGCGCTTTRRQTGAPLVMLLALFGCLLRRRL